MTEKIQRRKFITLGTMIGVGVYFLPTALFSHSGYNNFPEIAGKTGKTKLLSKPGLLLTFDDRNMINWEKYIPLFAKYNARVTFFVDRFDQLTPVQVASLHRLKERGHAIGCHGLQHLKATEFYKKYSIEKYIANEILPALEAMKEKGFIPTCFAYPSSNHDCITDRALRPYFRHVRSGLGKVGDWEQEDRAYVKISNIKENFRLDGFSFHPKSKNEELIVQAKKAIDRIRKNKEIVVMYAHDIRMVGEKETGHFIVPEALDEIMAYAAIKRVRMYSFDELP